MTLMIESYQIKVSNKVSNNHAPLKTAKIWNLTLYTLDYFRVEKIYEYVR